MRSSLSPSLIKATSGDYQLSIRAIFLETWQRITGMKKSFWGKFFLFFLIALTLEALLSFGLVSITSFYLKQSILTKDLYLLSGVIWKLLQWLLGISLVFLALKHIQNVEINVRMVLAAVKDWRVLSIVAILTYLFHFALFAGFYPMLSKLLTLDSFLGRLVLSIVFFAASVSYFYVIMTIVIARLLVLDKKISLKMSLDLVFSVINRRFVKNFSLVLLEWLIFLMGNILVSILIVQGMKLIGLGKWIFILSLSELILLPIFALITAIQYRQIFCEGEPVFRNPLNIGKK